MPSEDARRFELAVYVEPEHVEKVKAMIDDDTDNSLLLDIEKLIGTRLQIDDYGQDVAEVYCERES